MTTSVSHVVNIRVYWGNADLRFFSRNTALIARKSAQLTLRWSANNWSLKIEDSTHTYQTASIKDQTVEYVKSYKYLRTSTFTDRLHNDLSFYFLVFRKSYFPWYPLLCLNSKKYIKPFGFSVGKYRACSSSCLT